MGDRLIDRIIAAAPKERRMIHVPEWPGDCSDGGTDVYFKRLTRAQLDEAVPQNGDHPLTTQRLFVLTHMAEDREGNRLFKTTDIDALREFEDVTVLSRVDAFLWGTVAPSVTEAEETLKKTPSLSGDSPSPAS